MQNREHNLDRGYFLHGMLVDRDSSAVVDDAQSAVGHDRDVDCVAVPRKSLINRVVDDFVDQVVQAAFTGRADVHSGTLTYRLETLKNLDLICAVFLRVGCRGLWFARLGNDLAPNEIIAFLLYRRQPSLAREFGFCAPI